MRKIDHDAATATRRAPNLTNTTAVPCALWRSLAAEARELEARAAASVVRARGVSEGARSFLAARGLPLPATATQTAEAENAAEWRALTLEHGDRALLRTIRAMIHAGVTCIGRSEVRAWLPTRKPIARARARGPR